MIDYEELLRKYMAHVISCDGSSFIDSIEYIGLLSDYDKVELKKIDMHEMACYSGENNDIDTVILFGTLKEKPAKLPPEVSAHWIQGGLLKNDQAIEEAA